MKQPSNRLALLLSILCVLIVWYALLAMGFQPW